MCFIKPWCNVVGWGSLGGPVPRCLPKQSARYKRKFIGRREGDVGKGVEAEKEQQRREGERERI